MITFTDEIKLKIENRIVCKDLLYIEKSLKNIISGRGFLPNVDPLIATTDDFNVNEVFSKINAIATSLPIRIQENDFLFDVESCDVLVDCNNIPLMLRSYAMLASISQAYVFKNNDGNSFASIAKNLSTCLLQLSEALGRLPTQTYETYVLQNYMLKDEAKGYILSNIEPLVTYTGTDAEKWFIKVHVVSEYLGGQVLKDLSIIHHLEKPEDLEYALKTATVHMQELNSHLLTMNEGITGEEFFFMLRPYLKSYSNGIKYSNNDGIFSNVVKWRGPSGAQSSIIPALDRLMELNVVQLETMEDMYNYMPYEHQKYLDFISESTQIKKMAFDFPLLQKPYNDMVLAIRDFREIHYKAIIDQYILPNIVKVKVDDIFASTQEVMLLNKDISHKILHSFFSTIKSYLVEKKIQDTSKDYLMKVVESAVNLLPCDVDNRKIQDLDLVMKQCEAIKAILFEASMLNMIHEEKSLIKQIFQLGKGAVEMDSFGTGGTDFTQFLQENIIMTKEEIFKNINEDL